jgi:hypothetical protein
MTETWCWIWGPAEVPTRSFGEAGGADRNGLRPRHDGRDAGTGQVVEYEDGLRRSRFEDISITPTHEEEDGIYLAIVKARKPKLDS